MIELGPGADLFRLVGGLFWLILLVALLAALLVPKSIGGKAIAVAVVIGWFIAYPGRWVWERKQVNDAFRAQRAKALAHFTERCKTAGEFIYQTVTSVEGLFIGEVPRKRIGHEWNNQDAPDVYNWDYTGDDYIQSFLLGRNAEGGAVAAGHIDHMNPLKDDKGESVPDVITRRGYEWVEAIDPVDGRRYRYTGEFRIQPDSRDYLRLYVRRGPPDSSPPRYAIERIDISTAEDRSLWVAGGTLRVIDLHSGEVLAERIGYLVDPAQGSTAGARSPWLYATTRACPPFPRSGKFTAGARIPFNQTRLFVEKILKTKGDE